MVRFYGATPHGNLLISIALTWITNPVTFVPLNFFIYKIGQLVTQDPAIYRGIDYFDWHDKNLQEIVALFWQWLTSMGKPFLIGLPIVAFSIAFIGYLLVNMFWKFIIYWEWRHRKKPK